MEKNKKAGENTECYNKYIPVQTGRYRSEPVCNTTVDRNGKKTGSGDHA